MNQIQRPISQEMTLTSTGKAQDELITIMVLIVNDCDVVILTAIIPMQQFIILLTPAFDKLNCQKVYSSLVSLQFFHGHGGVSPSLGSTVYWNTHSCCGFHCWNLNMDLCGGRKCF